MAGFATHDIFGQEAAEQISDDMLSSIIQKHMGVYGIGCQGPDLFLYNIFMQIGNEQKNAGRRMHQEGTSRFFACLLWSIWNTQDYMWMEAGLSYLYGALAHYVLDSRIHPYVYARIGFDPEFPGSQKATSGIHHRLESAIDAKVIAGVKEIMPSAYQPLENITISKEEKAVLGELLAHTVKKSYHIGMRTENVTASIRMMQKIVCHFYGCSDKQKKRLERLEGTFFEDYLCSNFLVTDEYINKRKVLNTERKTWCNPWKVSEKSNDTVWDIYDKAMQQYQEYVDLLQPLISLYLRKWVSLRHPYYAYRKGEEKGQPMPGTAMEEMTAEELWHWICQIAGKLGNLSYYSGLPAQKK
ncbi:MAG: zinc dependent phospholipase C family protein [Butyribacter sp.]|nr:zinc dependent phospholipase C family protein [Butyribacter sp.]